MDAHCSRVNNIKLTFHSMKYDLQLDSAFIRRDLPLRADRSGDLIGSAIAFGKLSAHVGGKALTLPAHVTG
jgi:hypothetical protein